MSILSCMWKPSWMCWQVPRPKLGVLGGRVKVYFCVSAERDSRAVRVTGVHLCFCRITLLLLWVLEAAFSFAAAAALALMCWAALSVTTPRIHSLSFW